jgi:TATA-binding protein-associated factor
MNDKSAAFAHLPSLIVCPPSLCRHWLSEIQVFAPFLRPHLHGGNRTERRSKAEDFSKYDVIITSYETLKKDVDSCFAGKLVFNYMVLDEGHISINFLISSKKSENDSYKIGKICDGMPSTCTFWDAYPK